MHLYLLLEFLMLDNLHRQSTFGGPLTISALNLTDANITIEDCTFEAGATAFDPENALFFGVGPLTGSYAPCAGRAVAVCEAALALELSDSIIDSCANWSMLPLRRPTPSASCAASASSPWPPVPA